MSDHAHSLNAAINYGQHNHSITPPGYNPYIRGPAPTYTYGRVPISGEIALSLEEYRRQINHSIFEDRVLLNQLTKQAQEKPMSTLDKIKQERREKREREELEAKFEAWETHLGQPSKGDVVTFTVDFDDKTYNYAAIFADERWFLTGATTCGMPIETFIAWLIEKKVEVTDLMFLEPVE